MNVQRTNREKMSAERKALLDELGFIWDPRKAAWDEGYEEFRAFEAREGHCRVPGTVKSNSGFRLGQWVSVQRSNRDKMSAERRALLDELRFDWGVRTNRSKTD